MLLGTIEENPQAWEEEDRFETQVYQEGSDRVIQLPRSATRTEALQLCARYYPDAQVVSFAQLEKAWKAAGYYLRGRMTGWKRSQYQCPSDGTELVHTDGEYSGEYNMLRHVSFRCPSCAREFVDASENASFGRVHSWQTRLPGEEWMDCSQPPDLVKHNPYGFDEHLLERYA